VRPEPAGGRAGRLSLPPRSQEWTPHKGRRAASASLARLLWRSRCAREDGDVKFTFRNSTGRYQDHQIWFAIIGHQGAPFVHANFDGGSRATFVPCTAADNTVTKDGQTYSNYFYSIDKVPTAELPQALNSARVWLAIGDVAPSQAPLYIRVDGPTSIVQPSVSNPSDPNYNIIWDFLEFDYAPPGFFCNTSSVDAYSIPVTLTGSAGVTPSAVGYSANRAAVFSAFQPLGSPWSDLVITQSGTQLRILNPQYKMPPNGVQPTTFPANYFSEYVDHCWKVYTDIKVTLQYPRGGTDLYTGSVDGSGHFVFVKNDAPTDTGYRHTIAKPTTSADIFGCSGVFNQVGGSTPDYAKIDGDLKNQIASALNRTVLHNPSYEAWCQPASFYAPWTGGASPVANLYAKTLHAESIGGLCYAFAYDDQCEQSSSIKATSNSEAAEVTVTLTAF
jgi:beta-galactosidase